MPTFIANERPLPDMSTQPVARSRPVVRYRPAWLLPFIPMMLSACSVFGGNDAPAQKEPARINIAISADADMNTDLKGRGAPMLLRVYELKSEVAFQEAGFFALQDTDKAALGADILAVDQFILRPGETRQITRKSNPETTAIGVFAGYRDLPNATWRLVHKMQPAAEASWYRAVVPANKTQLRIDLHANALQITDELAGKRPVQYADESKKGLDPNALSDVKQQVESVTQPVGETLRSLPKAPAK